VLLDDLLARRLLVLSGKGGVGKSLMGTALAVAAQRRGKRVLLVEVDTPAVAEASRFLGAAPGDGTERELRPGLLTVNLDPPRVMDDYVRHVVRAEFLARRVLNSPIYHRFFAAAPGLRELMVLGRVMTFEEARAGWGRKPRYDLIVLDAPATGHGLAFLKIPQAAADIAPVGPVGANARRVLALLRDPERTALVLVAVPEEMAVVEAVEFHRLAVEQVGMAARAVLLNECHERRFSKSQEAEVLRLTAENASGRLAGGVDLESALDAARRLIRRERMTRFYQRRLRTSLDLPLVSLPFLFEEEIGPAQVEHLADCLEAA
jgi:anion-transporting  ArsA/GET3 family ATPase